MGTSKKRIIRPNLGGPLRHHAETPRHQFLLTDVTEDEYQKIQRHCIERQISISQFLADLVLKDARENTPKRKQKVIVRINLELTPEEQDKLELLVRLRNKESLSELIYDLLQPSLQVQRLHSPLETKTLRYYLSEEEHEIVTRHVAAKGISARNYAAMLALREMAKGGKRRK